MHCLVAPVTHALRQQPIQRQSLSCSRLHRRANVIMHTTTAMVKNRSINNPDDSPLRDGNRDRLYGLLTERACATLIAYTIETNQNLAQWLAKYFQEHPIPRKGGWSEISGDDFLMRMLMTPPETVENPYTFDKLTIDPRNLAMRIMDIRKHLATEFAGDLKFVADENTELMKEAVVKSLKNSFAAADSTPESEQKKPEAEAAAGAAGDEVKKADIPEAEQGTIRKPPVVAETGGAAADPSGKQQQPPLPPQQPPPPPPPPVGPIEAKE